MMKPVRGKKRGENLFQENISLLSCFLVLPGINRLVPFISEIGYRG